MPITRRNRLEDITVEPNFRVSDMNSPLIADKKINDVFRAVISFKVIEKTKSFTVLQVGSVMPFPTKRLI